MQKKERYGPWKEIIIIVTIIITNMVIMILKQTYPTIARKRKRAEDQRQRPQDVPAMPSRWLSTYKVELLAVLVGLVAGWDTVSNHYARGFGMCIYSAVTFTFLIVVVYTTALTSFIILASPGVDTSPAFQHACRLHYILASAIFLAVLVFIVTKPDGLARESVRFRVITLAIANMLIYCLLAFMV